MNQEKYCEFDWTGSYFLSSCTYADSYYFGKILGDVVAAAIGAGLTVKSIFEMFSEAGMTDFGTVTAPTGVGVCVAAVGSARVADGAITIDVGLEMAASAFMNASGDSKDYDANRGDDWSSMLLCILRQN